MRVKLLNDSYPKTYAVVFGTGDEVLAGLQAFAESNDVAACQVTGIGAVSDAVLGYFDPERKDYLRNVVRNQSEVLTLAGDITCGPDGHQLHLHAVLADESARAYGGHLLEAHVRPTLEAIVSESPGYLTRAIDPETKLPLVRG